MAEGRPVACKLSGYRGLLMSCSFALCFVRGLCSPQRAAAAAVEQHLYGSERFVFVVLFFGFLDGFASCCLDLFGCFGFFGFPDGF